MSPQRSGHDESIEARVAAAIETHGLPAEMLDGMEQRRTAPTVADDPAELAARLADLQARIAEHDASAGDQDVEQAEVPRPVEGWETVGREEAAQRLAERGVDVATARGMVTDYLRQTSELIGTPVYQWGLDQGDVEAIAAEHHLSADRDDDQLDDRVNEVDDDAAGWER